MGKAVKTDIEYKERCGSPIEEVYGIYIGMIMTIIHQ